MALQAPAQIAVRIVGTDEGRPLNLQYRGKDYATNVLTFDYAREPVVSADLVLCAPVVEREAQEQGKTLAAHYAHLLVHGALHAQGYDHETASAMRWRWRRWKCCCSGRWAIRIHTSGSGSMSSRA